MPINLPDYNDDEEIKKLEIKYKALKRSLLKDYDPPTLERVIMKRVIPALKAATKEKVSNMGKDAQASNRISFSTFTISKDVYKRYFEIEKLYLEKYFAGKIRYFNEYIIKNGCEYLMKLKGKMAVQPIKNKVYLKLWFLEYISADLNTAREKILGGKYFDAKRVNSKKIMFNIMLINAGLDSVEELGK